MPVAGSRPNRSANSDDDQPWQFPPYLRSTNHREDRHLDLCIDCGFSLSRELICRSTKHTPCDRPKHQLWCGYLCFWRLFQTETRDEPIMSKYFIHKYISQILGNFAIINADAEEYAVFREKIGAQRADADTSWTASPNGNDHSTPGSLLAFRPPLILGWNEPKKTLFLP